MKILLDFETRSPVDIKKSGPWVYAENPDTDVMCLAFKVDDEPVCLWVPYHFESIVTGHIDTFCQERILLDLIDRAEAIEAHNAEFERAIWRCIMGPRYGWPDIHDNKWRCSAAKAAAYALPRSLEGAGTALDLAVQKDKEGHRLMLKLCRPRKPLRVS